MLSKNIVLLAALGLQPSLSGSSSDFIPCVQDLTGVSRFFYRIVTTEA
jgi:hypothetical protein